MLHRVEGILMASPVNLGIFAQDKSAVTKRKGTEGFAQILKSKLRRVEANSDR